MLQEFFARDISRALEKARQAAGRDVFDYRVVEDVVIRTGKQQKVAIVVDLPESRPVEKKDPKGKPGEPDELEQSARQAGGSEWARAFCQGVLARMGYQVEVTASEIDGFVVLAFDLPFTERSLQAGVWREFRGALQHLINRSVGEGREGDHRYLVDIGGSLQRRRKAMNELADYLTEKIPRLGKALDVHLMDSQDRRLLHTGLRQKAGIETGASGNKRYRVMRIGPTVGADG